MFRAFQKCKILVTKLPVCFNHLLDGWENMKMDEKATLPKAKILRGMLFWHLRKCYFENTFFTVRIVIFLWNVFDSTLK